MTTTILESYLDVAALPVVARHAAPPTVDPPSRLGDPILIFGTENSSSTALYAPDSDASAPAYRFVTSPLTKWARLVRGAAPSDATVAAVKYAGKYAGTLDRKLRRTLGSVHMPGRTPISFEHWMTLIRDKDGRGPVHAVTVHVEGHDCAWRPAEGKYIIPGILQLWDGNHVIAAYVPAHHSNRSYALPTEPYGVQPPATPQSFDMIVRAYVSFEPSSAVMIHDELLVSLLVIKHLQRVHQVVVDEAWTEDRVCRFGPGHGKS